MNVSPATDEPDPHELKPPQDLTTDELDDLIWDIAVGRPTRVVLDTATKRARFFAVRKIIRAAVVREHIIKAPS